MDNYPHLVGLSKCIEENSLVTENSKNVEILAVIDKSLFDEDLEKMASLLPERVAVKFTHTENIEKESKESLYDAILSGVIGNAVPCNFDLLSTYIQLLASGGTLIVKSEHNNVDKLLKNMIMCGFLKVVSNKNTGLVVGNSPKYKIGSSDKIVLNSKAKENVISAWKLDDNNSETISEDDLLEADDLKKPDSSSLKVCATTKKAKACKDCSCGLAEELEAQAASKLVTPKPDTSNAKSSCGSCYLGDAFRCASCPYLGMPAFKPGEKVQLAGNLLQDDL